MVRCYIDAGQDPADRYRICTTWREPVDPELAGVLEPCAAPGTFDGYPTKRYRLRPDVLWPDGGRLIWNLRKPSVAIRRVDLVRFSERLVIELECPQISISLASPGALERLVLEYLSERIGVGRYPNQHSRVTDVAARLIIRASHARARQETLDPSSLVAELELRTDYGRVAQRSSRSMQGTPEVLRRERSGTAPKPQCPYRRSTLPCCS